MNKKIKELKSNQEFKSYRQLCNFLNEKIKSGDSKISQIKEWEQYFDYEKIGYKFIIKRVRAEEDKIKKEDNRQNNKGGNNNIYSDYIDKLIINALINNNNIINETFTNIFTLNDFGRKYIPIFTQYYKDIKKYNNKEIAERYKIHPYSYGKYINTLNAQVNNLFRSSLNRLQREGILQWDKSYMLMTNYSLEPVLAENYEYDINCKEKIIETEYITLSEMGITKRELFFNENLYDTYKEQNLDKIKEISQGDIFSYWNVYTINLITKNLHSQDLRIKYEIETINEFDLLKNFTSTIKKRNHKMLRTSKQYNKDTNENKSSYKNSWHTKKLISFLDNIEKDIFVCH